MEDYTSEFASPPSDEPIILGDPSGEMMYDFGAPPTSNDSYGYGDAFIGTIDETSPPVAMTDDYDAPSDFDAPIILGPPPEEYEAPPVVLVPEEVPETVEEDAPIVPVGPSPMQLFNDEFQALLLQRKDEENARKAELLAAAEESLRVFQQQRESKRDAKMAKNRSDEQEKLEAIEADLENDNSWQRVCKMVELSHDSSDVSADVTRMRDLMIQLKNDPNRATMLA
jgi:Clathrin light chain